MQDVQAQSDEVTIADTSSPPPPAGTTDGKTAVRAVLRVVGADVDPFNAQKQSDLMTALLSVMTTVTAASTRILYVAKVYPTSGRRLLSAQVSTHSEIAAERLMINDSDGSAAIAGMTRPAGCSLHVSSPLCPRVAQPCYSMSCLHPMLGQLKGSMSYKTRQVRWGPFLTPSNPSWHPHAA